MKKYIYSFYLILVYSLILNAQSIEFVTIKGIVKSYQSETTACLFVDKEMVGQGITMSLGNKASKICTDKKYEQGVLINFEGLNTEGDYATPPDQNILIEVRGRWVTSNIENYGKTSILHATEWEPFF